MAGNAAEAHAPKDPQHQRSESTGRVTRLAGALTVAAAALFAALDLIGFEGSFLMYVANVLAGLIAAALALLLLVRAALWQVRGKSARQNLLPLPWCALIAAMLIPVVQGELRRGPLASGSTVPTLGEISVLDANLFGPTDVGDDLLREISRLKPDIILLQELNPRVAERLAPILGDEYSCKVLNPQDGTTGMGVYSRFPCTAQQLARTYFAAGQPQLVSVTLPDGKRIAVANVHTNPPHVLPPSRDLLSAMSETVALRELHAQNLLAELSAIPADGRLIAGDFNATVRNRIYKLVRSAGMQDAWSAAGRFTGGTWPNPRLPLARWLLRLDFVFSSEALVPRTAENLATSGGSDHRGLIVRLAWR